MLDRRDLRFWLRSAGWVWLSGILIAVILWGFALLFGSREMQDTMFSLRRLLCVWLFSNVMAILIGVSSWMRAHIPLTLSFGATRRSAALTARLTHILPILMTMLAVLALGCIEALRISPMAVIDISAMAFALCSLGDFVSVLALNHRFWVRISLIFCALAGGMFGGMISTSLFATSDDLFRLIINLEPSPIDTAVIAVSLGIALVANLGSALVMRRISVQF